MDQIYTTVKEKLKYQRETAKDPIKANAEQEWYEEFMQSMQDLFGCIEFQQAIHCYYSTNTVELEILQNKKPKRGDVVADCDIMCSRGSEDSTHWLSKRQGQEQFFDPYDEFQI